MAAMLSLVLGRAVSSQLLPVPPTCAVAVRFASKKTGGSSKNRGGKSPGKRYGFKKLEGNFVHAGNILATQRVMRWYPGAHFQVVGQPMPLKGALFNHDLDLTKKTLRSEEFPLAECNFVTSLFRLQPILPSQVLLIMDGVGLGHKKWLYALEDGIVRYTKEVYVPTPRSKEGKEMIPQLPKGAVLYKTFINVVPTVEVGSFKLVNML